MPRTSMAWIARVAEHPALIGSAVALLAVLAGLVLLPPVQNGDFAWHLALGRWMHATGSVPSTEPFTYTAYGAPMVAHEWLSQWFYWWIAEAQGITALRVWHGVGAAMFVGGVFVAMRRAAVSPALALLGSVVFLAIAIDRLQVRPHILNLCIGLTLYTLAFIERPRLTRRQIAGFAAAVAVWANAHSEASYFPALLFGYACVDAVDRRILKRVKPAEETLGAGKPIRVWQLVAACAFALLATPNHIRLLPYLVASGRANFGHSLEWLSILRIAQEPGFGVAVAGWVAAFVGALWATAVVFRNGRALAPVAVAVACVLAPLQSVRFTWLAFAPLIFALAEVSKILARQPAVVRDRIGIGASALACIAIPLLFWPAEGIAARLKLAEESPSFAANAFPVGSAQLLEELTREAPLEGRLFARAEWGGYLTLTLDGRYPIFADGRWVTIGREIVLAGHHIATGRDEALKLADDFDLEILVVERDWLEAKPEERDRTWLLAFAAYNSQIYIRRDASGDANRKRFADYYQALGIPFDRERGFDAFSAWNANHAWAREHRVRRKHVRHFAADGSGKRSEGGAEVVDWEQRQPTPP